VRVEFVGGEMKVMVQKSAQVGRAVGGVGNNSTRLQVERIMPSSIPGWAVRSRQAIGQARFRDGQALAHVERSALVIHADELVSHYASLIMCAS
jgi:hypothetical protein